MLLSVAITVSGSFVGIALLQWLSTRQLQRALAQARASNLGLRDYRDHLEELVQERTSALEMANAELQHEIVERRQAEEALRKARNELEHRVRERTAELETTNTQLLWEIAERVQVEEALRKRAAQLAVVNQVARKVASILEPERLLPEIAAAIQQGFGYYNVILLQVDESTGTLGEQALAGGFEDMAPPDYPQAVGEGIIGWTAERGQSLLVNDVSQDPRYIVGFSAEVPTRSELCVPIKLAGRVVGVLDVQDTELNAFHETDLVAMETLADQIAVAVENARLFEAERTQLRLAQTLHEVGALLTTRMSLDEVFEQVFDLLAQVVDYDSVSVQVPDQHDRLYIAAWRGYPDIEAANRLVCCFDVRTMHERWGGQSVVVLPDTLADERWIVAPGVEYIRSWIRADLLVKGRSIGSLNLESVTPDAYDAAAGETVAAFANQAAVAIENARLYDQAQHEIAERMQAEEALQRRNSELELLNRAGQALISTLDQGQVLTTVLGEVRQLLDVVACSIWLRDPETDELVCQQATGPRSEMVHGWRLAPGEGFAGWVVRHGESLIVPDAQADERYFEGVDEQTGLGLRSILAVPLRVKGDVIGVLEVLDTRVNRFRPIELMLVESLSTTAAVAIDNARLYEQARRDAETRATLLREVNHRVKNNLTGIIGLLYTARDRARVEDRETYRSTMNALIDRVRGLAAVHSMLSASEWTPLRLSDLANHVIRAALRAQPRDKRVSVDVRPSPVRVTPDEAHNLALVINELAINAVKYALRERDRACITFQIALDSNTIRFEFRDDGPGYPENVLRLECHSVGFDLIQRIVRRGLGGELSLYNDDGAVAVIEVKAGLGLEGEGSE
jgi:GAF domain-containing protein/anti-sigma regulatory factor (Ser/Thr protein kinase)